jgi:hypothetical protein
MAAKPHAGGAVMTKEVFDWREHLAVHPAADLLPPLSDAELRALADDIKANGLCTNIVLWSPADPGDKYEGLLDGVHRLNALALLGLLGVDSNGKLATTKMWDGKQWVDDAGTYRELRRQYKAGGDPYQLALSFNVHRRHLTAEQKRNVTAALLKAKPEASNVAIAKQVKADDKTVAKVRSELEGRSEIPNVKTRTDSKGRKQPAKKAKSTETKATAKIKDTAQENFDALVLELARKIKGQKPQRFAKTAVPFRDILQLSNFLTGLVPKQQILYEEAMTEALA